MKESWLLLVSLILSWTGARTLVWGQLGQKEMNDPQAAFQKLKGTDLARQLFDESKAKAESGDANAQFTLGMIYGVGLNGTTDLVEAVKWCRKSAEQGFAPAQCILGKRIEEGAGVPRDFVEAYKWYNLAAAQIGVAALQRDDLQKRMTPEQIAEGQRLAREFRPSQEKEPRTGFIGANTLEPPLTSIGSGFLISADGFVVTVEHVVRGARQIRLVTRAGSVPAKLVKADTANDIALLKVTGNFLPLPVVPSRGVKLGSTVATVGFPNVGLQGFAPKLAKGEIAALSGAQDDPRCFQISVPVQPGNSGGPLVDEKGNVVGIVSAKLSTAAAIATTGALPENVNYAIKSSLLLSFLESVPDATANLKEANVKVVQL
jgi:S1-C subfamily serine protease